MKHLFTVTLILTLTIISSSARTLHSSHHSSTNILSQANDHFTVALLQNLELQHQREKYFQPKQNILISSFSLSSTLTMLLAGAVNTTYSQIYDTIGLNISHLKTSTLFADYSTLVAQLNKQNQKVLTVSAALAIQKNFALNEVFIDNITAVFGTQVFVEDFSTNASKSTEQINNWISDETQNNIDHFFNQSMPDNTGASLLNSLYFKGGWKISFKVTEKGYLQATSVFNYIQLSVGQLVEIPYSKPASLCLYLFLPLPTFNGSSISSLLTSEQLETAIASMKPLTVSLILPQFNITSSLLNSEAVLSKLGIVDAFTGNADFYAVNSDYNLRLSKMLVSKITIKLSELNTEVSAASGLILAPAKKEETEIQKLEFLGNSLLNEELQNYIPLTTQNFTADRPFLFLIRDTVTQLTLFSGVVNDFK